MYPECGQNHARDLLLNRFWEDVSQHWDHIVFVHFSGQFNIKSADPQTECKLILYLEVDSTSEHWNDGWDAIDADHEHIAIIIHLKHHLQTSRYCLQIFIPLNNNTFTAHYFHVKLIKEYLNLYAHKKYVHVYYHYCAA